MSNDPVTRSRNRFDAIVAAARSIQAAIRAALQDRIPPGASVRAVARRLDIGPYLAWKMLGMIRSDDIHEIIGGIPGTRGCRSLSDSIRRTFGDEHAADRVTQAFERYRELIADLDYDQQELAIMLSHDQGTRLGSTQAEATAAKVVEHYSLLRGHRIELALGGTLALPSANHPGRFDAVHYELLHGISRLRPGKPILVHTRNTVYDERQHDRSDIGADLVASASTPDLEDEEIVVTRTDTTMAVHLDLSPDRIEPVTVGFLQVVPNMGSILAPKDRIRPRKRWFDNSAFPVRKVMVEYLQPAAVPGPTDAIANSEFMSPGGPTSSISSNADPVPIPTPVSWHKTPDLTDHMASVAPFYRELLTTALSGTGIALDDLRCVRAEQAFPLPSTVVTLIVYPATDADVADSSDR